MNFALRQPWTIDSFLAWENNQPLRYEFDGFQPIAMAGGTAAHSAIQRNLITALTIRLRGNPCQAHGSELKLRVNERIRYPDAFVVCTPLPPRATVVTEPVIVFGVLSDGTAGSDLVTKNADYRSTPSIQRYVILEQTHAGAMVFARKGEDWATELVFGESAILHLPEIDAAIPLAEIYADIELAASEATQ